MPNPIKVDLQGRLAGRHIVVDDDKITMGFFESLQTEHVAAIIAAVAGVIVEADLPHMDTKGATVADALRQMKPTEFRAVVEGIKGLPDLPKAS